MSEKPDDFVVLPLRLVQELSSELRSLKAFFYGTLLAISFYIGWNIAEVFAG